MSIKKWFEEKFKDEEELEVEKIKKGKMQIEEKYHLLLEDMDSLSSKYISLLEQKSERFDLYVDYQNQCADLLKEKKELKKQLAESTETCRTLTECNEELLKQVEKLERKIKRMEKQNAKSNQ